MDKSKVPDDELMSNALGKQFRNWNDIKAHVLKRNPAAMEEWSYSKYGWNYRLKTKKAVIIYLMPCSGYFNASFVLGKKSSETALGSSISEDTRQIIDAAKIYADGRGFRLAVDTASKVADVKKLIDIKLDISGNS